MTYHDSAYKLFALYKKHNLVVSFTAFTAISSLDIITQNCYIELLLDIVTSDMKKSIYFWIANTETFKAWCPMKVHTYLNKPTAFNCCFV